MFRFRNPNRWRDRGDGARDRRDWAGAIRAYEKHLARAPRDGAIRVQLGHVYKESGLADRALGAYDMALETDEERLPIERTRAFLLRDMGRTNEAIESFVARWDDPECRGEAISLGAAEILRNRVFEEATPNDAAVWLEIGDLVRYHLDHARPSGIQRVIAGCVAELLRLRSDIALVMITAGGLVQEVSPEQFAELVALTGSEAEETIFSYARRLSDDAPFVRPVRPGLIFTFGAFWHDDAFLDATNDLKARGRRLVAMVHDLIPLTHPEFAGEGVAEHMGPAFERLRRSSDWMVAVSDRTRTAMVKLGASEAACRVARLCHDVGIQPQPGTPPKERSVRLDAVIEDRPFVLCVGTIEPRKNHDLLLRLWRTYETEGLSPPRLALAGRTGWDVGDLIARIKTAEAATGAILRLGPVSDAELAQLYRDCLLTVFPSFVEGWGLPAGESLAHGKVCVASKEVADVSDALLTFDPHDLGDLRRVLDPLLFEKGALTAATTALARIVARGWPEVAVDLNSVIEDRLASIPPEQDYRAR